MSGIFGRVHGNYQDTLSKHPVLGRRGSKWHHKYERGIEYTLAFRGRVLK